MMMSLRHILTNCIKECNFLLTEEEINQFVEKILLTSTVQYKNDGSVILLEGGDNDIGVPQSIWDKALKMPKFLAFVLTNMDQSTLTRYCRLKGYSSFRDLEYDLTRGCIAGFEPNPNEVVLINGDVQKYIRKELEGFNFHPYYIEWVEIKPYRLHYKDGEVSVLEEFSNLLDLKNHLKDLHIPVDGDIHEIEVFCMQDLVPLDFVITDIVWDSRIPGPGGKIIQIDVN